jgi:SAM-dependent methyltransferase
VTEPGRRSPNLRRIAKRAARRLPQSVRGVVRRAQANPHLRRVTFPVRWGSVRRTQPISNRWGADRGTAVDRHYLNRFFSSHAGDMHGRVLEIGSSTWSSRYGRGVTGVDIVDIDPRNDAATIIADLAEPDSLSRSAFDCVIVPQTLQFVSDLDCAFSNLWGSVAPGGTLLVTVPTVSKIDHNSRQADRWRLTGSGLEELLRRCCVGGETEVVTYGNVLTACAFLYGVSMEELKQEELDVNDVDFPLLACGWVRRPASS